VLFQKKPEKNNKTQCFSTVRSSKHLKNNSLFLNSFKKNKRYLENSCEHYEKNEQMHDILNKEALLKIFATNPKDVLLFINVVFKENLEVYKNSEYILINSKELLNFFNYSMKLSLNNNNKIDFWKNMEEFMEENVEIKQKSYNKEYKFLQNLNENKTKRSKVNKSCEFTKDSRSMINKSLEVTASKCVVANKEKNEKCSIF